MKYTPRLFIALVCVLATFAQAQAQRQPAANKLLFDFRIVRPYTGMPKIPAATQSNVFRQVFRRYLADESRCNRNLDFGVGDHLRAARNAGQIVPAIFDVAEGSFTAAGQVETLYVIGVNECNASHADNFGSKRVAIFNGQRLIAEMDVEFRSSVTLKTDLNGDGINELLMTSGDMNQGIVFEAASLVEFRNGRLRVVQDLGQVIDDPCAAGYPGSSVKAATISTTPAAPGSMPKLRVDIYQAGCRKVKRWRFVSTGKMV